MGVQVWLACCQGAIDPIIGQHLGILVIELGVGITIAAGMILIFFAFSHQAESQLGEE